MQLPGGGFTIRHNGTVPGAPLSDFKTLFFGLHLYLTKRFSKNFQNTKGPTQCKSGPVNSMGNKRNYPLQHFSITIHLHSPVFENKLKKKISKGSAH